MSKGHVLDGLIKWSDRAEWRDLFGDVYADHAEEICAEWDVDPDQLAELLGDDASVVWACVFEDFLTRPRDDETTPVDDYLKRRGWKESATNRRYMEALRDSFMSLHEVSAIVPGESFLARDLILGGEPVKVSERSATRSLRPWDRIGARVVEVNGRRQIAGGVLRFGLETAEELRAEISGAIAALGEAFSEERERNPLPESDLPDGLIETICLMQSAPLFTQYWLDDHLAAVLDPKMPRLVNGDGDDIAFHTLTFPLKPGVSPAHVRERMERVPAFRGENDNFWNWIGRAGGTSPANGKTGAGDARVYHVEMDDGSTVLGNIELGEGVLTLSCNSANRAQVGRAVIVTVAEDVLGDPELSVKTVEDMLAAAPDEEEDGAGEASEPRFSAEEEARVVAEFTERHYRATLDQAVPFLGGKTPRAAARSDSDRGKVVEWLKLLENRSAVPNDGRPQDLEWMWRELGVEALRK